jgi:L-serine kinase (ADP)
VTVKMIDPKRLRHIEGFSKQRVAWLKKKVLAEKVWTKPLAIEKTHLLVMDGQHRMEVACALGLRRVPCELFSYDEVEVYSLRKNQEVTPELVVERSLRGDIYPYKTAKHRFPRELPQLAIPLAKLR